jgi:membrane protein YdbS with pleckstrin-like domain
MEDFTNEQIDTDALPKFETVLFTALHPKYWTVIVFNCLLFFVGLGAALASLLFYNRELTFFLIEISILLLVFIVVALILLRIGYTKKGYAFREHDVLFRQGIIATSTTVIPYNRIQHVALHESLLARYFGLAKIEIFTAGGSSSDLVIPGIAIIQAENIKQLLMVKIQKQL